MQRALLPVLFAISTGCAVATPDGDTGGAGVGGKADGLGTVPATGTWKRTVVSDSSTLWNGGPTEWGAGTSIGVRADGEPVIAYYDASNRCNNGGWGTYSPDALLIANRTGGTVWKRAIQACGPEWGYWPRLLVDDQDRTHVLFGGGWATRTQRAFYVRLDPTGKREVGRSVDGGYMSSGALAMTLDDANEPVLVSNGQFVAADGTKTKIFNDRGFHTFTALDTDGALHVVGSTMIPETATSSTSRMRYAYRAVDGTVTIEEPRSVPQATPRGLVIDSDGVPHVLSWNSVATGGGELWESTRTATGWEETLITTGYDSHAALAIDASGELIVVTSGRLHRRAVAATSWTSTAVPALASARYPSIAIADDGTLHVAFYVVGSTMSNRVARAPIYHASFTPTP